MTGKISERETKTKNNKRIKTFELFFNFSLTDTVARPNAIALSCAAFVASRSPDRVGLLAG